MRRAISLATIAPAVPAAAHAASPVEILISDAGQEDETGAVLVDLRLLNDSGDPQGMALPDRIEAQVEQSGVSRTAWLERMATTPPNPIIPPGGFTRATYRLARRTNLSLEGAAISVPAWGTRQITLALELYNMPEAAQIYVVVHEYCHFLVLDHSPKFWAEVEKILPDWKARRELLK